MGIFATIFGSSKIIDAGLSLIDDAFYTDSEKAEDKQKAIEGKGKAKINLLNAYAPFKVTQRYLALMFGGMFVVSFFLVLSMTLAGYNVAPVFKVMEEFKVGWVMMTIVMFYFGGGLVESIGTAKRK